MCAEEVVTERPMPGFDQAAIDGYAVRSVDVSVSARWAAKVARTVRRFRRGRRARGPGAAGDGHHRGRLAHAQPAAAAAGRAGADRGTAADAGRRGAAAAVDRRRDVAGAGAARRARRAPTCAAPATTSSPVTSRCGPGRSSARRRSGCWPRSAANGCWCTRGPRRVGAWRVGGELVDISRTPGNGQVYDVNSYALAAAARDAGAEVNRVGIVNNDPKELGEVVEGQINRAEIVVIAGAVGRRGGRGGAVGARRARRDGGHPGRHASRIGPGFRAAGPRGGSDVSAAGQPGERAGGFRGDGPAVDPVVAGQASADAPDRAGAHAVADHVGGRPQGLPARSADARPGHRRVSGAGARRRPGASSHLLATLAEANCLVVVPSEAEQIRTGEIVDVAFLAQRG